MHFVTGVEQTYVYVVSIHSPYRSRWMISIYVPLNPLHCFNQPFAFSYSSSVVHVWIKGMQVAYVVPNPLPILEAPLCSPSEMASTHTGLLGHTWIRPTTDFGWQLRLSVIWLILAVELMFASPMFALEWNMGWLSYELAVEIEWQSILGDNGFWVPMDIEWQSDVNFAWHMNLTVIAFGLCQQMTDSRLWIAV